MEYKMDYEKEILAMKTEIKRLTDENRNMAKLLNNHARLIDKHSVEIKETSRNFNSEINKIAAAFKKIQSVLNRGKE
jgi:hypothetical protein